MTLFCHPKFLLTVKIVTVNIIRISTTLFTKYGLKSFSDKFTLIDLRSYKPLMGYLIPKFDSFV